MFVQDENDTKTHNDNPKTDPCDQVLQQEEQVDRFWATTEGAAPGGPRPRSLKRRWSEAVAEAADGSLPQRAEFTAGELGGYLDRLRARVVEDLGAAKRNVVSIYPEDYQPVQVRGHWGGRGRVGALGWIGNTGARTLGWGVPRWECWDGDAVVVTLGWGRWVRDSGTETLWLDNERETGVLFISRFLFVFRCLYILRFYTFLRFYSFLFLCISSFFSFTVWYLNS